MNDGKTMVRRAEIAREPDILIVDDTPANLDVLCGMLRNRGYRIRVATNGSRALAAANASVPDLIMLDINMPGLNGYDVCRELKAEPATKSTPVIFISALDEVIDKVKAFEAGGVDYVTKPFEFGEVLARIENQLKISRLHRELEERNRELLRLNEELRSSQYRESRIFRRLSEVLPGTIIDGRYRLDEQIGSGGFGTVYRGAQINLNRPVAIKIFQALVASADPKDLDRFRREGVSACRVNHQNALMVIDSAVSTSGLAYLVTELLEGKTLAHEIDDEGTFDPIRAKAMMSTVCDVLVVAHDSGIIHRDIKPDNIFLHTSPTGEVIKVLDFGIAKLIGDAAPPLSSQTSKGVLIGTPMYMAPERLRGEAHDGKADVYSVGVTLYQMLTGEVPYKNMPDLISLAREGVAVLPGAIREKNPRVPADLEQIVYDAMAWEASARPTMRELRERLG